MEQTPVRIQANIQSTNHFKCKIGDEDKLFGFNIDLFQINSQYFKIHKNSIHPNSIININDTFEENIIFSESSINDFIKYCHNQQIELKQEDIPFLYELSKKFGVLSLLEHIKTIVSKYPHEYQIQYLILNQDKPNTEFGNQFEEELSNHLTELINDDQLLSLPINILHRIVTKYQVNNSMNNDHEANTKINNFLFKCLNHYGKKASILFEFVDFEDQYVDIIRRLLSDEFKCKFDFTFINKARLQTNYEHINEFIQKENEIKLQQNDFKKQLENFNDNLIQINKDINQIKNDIITIKNELTTSLNSQNSNQVKKLDELNNNIQSLYISKQI